MRRDDARPFAAASPRRVGIVATVLALPVAAWAALVSAPLAAAAVSVAVLAGWMAVRLAAEVQRQTAELGRLRSADALTGLANRRVWEDALPREIARSTRTGSPVAIAFLTVDAWDGYADSHGTQAADLLLKEIAALWPRELRDSDLLARHGGERFALLLPDCGIADVRDVVDKARRTMPAGATCSAGIATWDGVESAESLVGRAGDALEAARRKGPDRVVVADVPRPDPAAT